MKLSAIEECDLPSLAALYKQFWGEDSSPDLMRETFRRLEANPAYILLGARQGGRLVGSVMGIVCEDIYGECRPFMVIENVIVDASCRRSGVGSALMREMEKQALMRGCGYVIFVTENTRADACRFYQSLGYASDSHTGFKKRFGPKKVHE